MGPPSHPRTARQCVGWGPHGWQLRSPPGPRSDRGTFAHAGHPAGWAVDFPAPSGPPGGEREMEGREGLPTSSSPPSGFQTSPRGGGFSGTRPFPFPTDDDTCLTWCLPW